MHNVCGRTLQPPGQTYGRHYGDETARHVVYFMQSVYAPRERVPGRADLSMRRKISSGIRRGAAPGLRYIGPERDILALDNSSQTYIYREILNKLEAPERD